VQFMNDHGQALYSPSECAIVLPYRAYPHASTLV
jgi:hypothetical protein